MKRILALIFASLMLVTTLVSCTKNDGVNTNKDDDGKTVFTIGFDASFPPYGYRDEKTGEYVGFDLDLAKEVSKRNDWKLKLQPIEWDAKDGELDAGNISCIWNGFTMTGREDLYTWTDAYVDNSQVIVVKKESGITEYSQLADKVVAVQKDSSALAALKDDKNEAFLASFKELVTCGEYNTAFMDLESGAIDALAMDIGVAKFQMQGKEDKFIMLDEILAEEQYGIGFKLGNTELRDQVQNALVEMVKDGKFAEISNKWFGYDVGIIGK